MKNKTVAYILWFILGTLGVHRLYLGKIVSGIFQALVSVGVFLLSFLVVGLLLLPIVGIWWLIDGFLISKWVNKKNAAFQARINNANSEKPSFNS